MADRGNHMGATPVNNPLLSAAGNSFPFEIFASTAQLVPIAQKNSSIQLSEDVGEADSFLGQDALPSLPLPGVLPPALKIPSPEQLQPITFFNALGQPTGGGGLDFLAPAGANSKSIDSSSQPRYKLVAYKRHPLLSSSELSPSKLPASSIPLLPPTSQGVSQSSSPAGSSVSIPPAFSLQSPLFQEPSIATQPSLLPPKSYSSPSSPKTLPLSTEGPCSSKSQPSTLQPSPVHASQLSVLQTNQAACESLIPPIQLSQDLPDESPGKKQLDISLADRLLNLTTKTLNPASEDGRKPAHLSEPEEPVIKSAHVFSSAEFADSLAAKQVRPFSSNKSVTQKTESLLSFAAAQVLEPASESKVDLSNSSELLKPKSKYSVSPASSFISNPSDENKITPSSVDESKSPVTNVTSVGVPATTDLLIDAAGESSLNETTSLIPVHKSEERLGQNKCLEKEISSSLPSVEQTHLFSSSDFIDGKSTSTSDLTLIKQSPSLSTSVQAFASTETEGLDSKSRDSSVSSENQTFLFTEAEQVSCSTQFSVQATKSLTLNSETEIISSSGQNSLSAETEPHTRSSHYLPTCSAHTNQLQSASLFSSQSSSTPSSIHSFSSPASQYPCSANQDLHYTSKSSQFFSPTIHFSSPDFAANLPSANSLNLTPHQSHSTPEIQFLAPLGEHQFQPSSDRHFFPGTHQTAIPFSSPTAQVSTSRTELAPSPFRAQLDHPLLVPQSNSFNTHSPPHKLFVPSAPKAEPVQPLSAQPTSSPLTTCPPLSAQFLTNYESQHPSQSQPPSTQFGPLASGQFPAAPLLQGPLGSFPPSGPQFFTPPPAASYFPPPPPPTAAQATQLSPSNRYSIHARSQPLRNPYKTYAQPILSPLLHPAATQSSVPLKLPIPCNNPDNQAITFLIPTETSLEPLASAPLSAEAVLNIPKNPTPKGSLDPKLHPAIPIPSSSTVTLTSSVPASLIGHSHPNPFSAQALLSPNYTLQKSPVDSNILPQAQTASHSSLAFTPPVSEGSLKNHLNPVSPPSSYSSQTTSSLSSTSSQLIPQEPLQENSNASASTNIVPTTSPFTHPPSGAPLGAAKGYRLGKQRPRYAQAPDLALSPLTSAAVLSPLGTGSFPLASSPAAPEPFSIYPPGAVGRDSSHTDTLVSTSEEYLFPSASSQSEVFPSSFANLASQPIIGAASAQGISYHPVYCHWFFKKEVETKVLWKPFSVIDSVALENAFNSSETTEETVVATDGGRYDVKVLQRQRAALYWEEKKPTEVRRCSWFYKGPLDSRYTPYEEDFAVQLEKEYKLAFQSNKWNRKIEHNGETVVMHGPVVMVHYSQTGSADQIGVPPDSSPVKPRVVKRGVDEFEFEEGEPSKVDHLLFLVHGIGSVCDLKFRDVVETVDDFRSLALQLTRSHFSACVESGQASRVEVLPVSWHGKLHGEDTGIDRKLQSITLKSIPRLRHFTNDTLLDILFYTSPVYCQTIMDTVGNEMNRMYELFLKRNPNFSGSVSLGGHSLGSLILFDLLYHQKVPKHIGCSPAIVMTVPGSRPPVVSPDKEVQPDSVQPSEGSGEEVAEEDDIVDDAAMALSFSRTSSYNRRASRVNYMMGPAGTGQPYISYPQLKFKPENFFALGSPIGMFVTVRGIETLGSSFHLPTCPGFFNIFHPFDPVAYRVESLIDPELAPTLSPVLIPHHKGRKRMHLELKETMARMGSDLKNKLVDSVKNTWNTMTQYTMFSKPEPPPSLEQEVTKVLEAHLGSSQLDTVAESESESGEQAADITLGCLNGGRRVDYVLQEAPLESFNEYLFALQSHVCYWESEDTMLMILTEVYHSSGVSPDSAISGADASRERSPIKLLSDQLLPSASPPKPQIFSPIRFPSSTSLSSEGAGSSQGVARSQSVPKLSSDPNPTQLSTSSPGYLQTAGFGSQSPQMGVDPTVPMAEVKNLAPPPTIGFVRQALQRK